MAARDLTTLANVKAYLAITDANSDALLTRLITAMSYSFVQDAGRDILRKTYSEIFDGNHERILRRPIPSAWIGPGFAFALNLADRVIGDPVVLVDGVAIAKRVGLTGSGWVLLDGYRLEFVGVTFVDLTTDVGNTSITYDAGQYIPAEAATIPASGPYTIQASQSLGTFLADLGVVYASTGVALTLVPSAPAVGQYSVNATGLYTFAAADQGAAISLSYTHLPSDVEDCVIEMVAFKFHRRDRLDQVSATIGGQTVSFNREAWPVTVQRVIDRWRRTPV